MAKINLHTFGGYAEIGKSMSAIKIGEDIILIDMGGNMDKLVDFQTENPDIKVEDTDVLIDNDIIPNDREFFKEYGKNVRAIVISHGHLDHAWAVPFLARKYNVPIIGTPFTIEVIRNLNYSFHGRDLKLKKLNAGSEIKLGNIKIKLLPITHSIPQASLVYLQSQDAKVLYACDWKFDLNPLLGNAVNYDMLKQVGENGLDLLISETTRIDEPGSTFSESIAYSMIEDSMAKNKESKNIFFTTFASHIARIRSAIRIARRYKRRVVAAGRSLQMYFDAAIRTGIVRREELTEVLMEKKEINEMLRNARDHGNYFIIGTGNQGEPGSFLSKLAIDALHYKLSPEDLVIFSSQAIPTEVNLANRSMLQRTISEKGTKIMDNVHVSGHASYEDHKKMLSLLKPKVYIPAHGGMQKQLIGIKLAEELGYKLNNNVFLIGDNVDLNLDV